MHCFWAEAPEGTVWLWIEKRHCGPATRTAGLTESKLLRYLPSSPTMKRLQAWVTYCSTVGIRESSSELLVSWWHEMSKFAADLLFGALALAEEEQGWFIFNAILTGLQSEDFDIDSHLTSSRGSENPWVRFGVEATLDWLDSLGYRPPFRSGS